MRKNHKKLALNLSSLSTSSNVVVQPPLTAAPEQDMQYKNNSLLYRQGPACILSNLYLGAHYNASNAHQLAQFNIRCIINVASEITNSSSSITMSNTITYHHLHWTHCQNNLAHKEFAQAIAKIEYAHSQHQNVLIHCQQGIERSAALVIAFLLFSSRQSVKFTAKTLLLASSNNNSSLTGQNWTLDCALKYVQKRASGIRPNMELLYQLREYEKLINNTTPPYTPITAVFPNTTRTSRGRSESVNNDYSANNKDSSRPATKRMPNSSSFRNLATTAATKVIHTRQRAASFKDASSRTFSYSKTSSHNTTTAPSTIKKGENNDNNDQKVQAMVLNAAVHHNQQPYHHFMMEGKNDDHQTMTVENEEEEVSSSSLIPREPSSSSFFLMRKPVYPIY